MNKNILILAMPRTLGTLLFESLREQHPGANGFYEPGLCSDWRKKPSGVPVAEHFERCYRQVDDSLLQGAQTIVKVLPCGPFNQIGNERLLAWTKEFDTVIVMNRPLEDIARSFLIAKKADSWIVYKDRQGITDDTVIEYDPATDFDIFSWLIYAKASLDYWDQVVTSVAHPKVVRLNTTQEVLDYMAQEGLSTAVTTKQKEPKFVGSEAFSRDLALAKRFYEVKQ